MDDVMKNKLYNMISVESMKYLIEKWITENPELIKMVNLKDEKINETNKKQSEYRSKRKREDAPSTTSKKSKYEPQRGACGCHDSAYGGSCCHDTPYDDHTQSINTDIKTPVILENKECERYFLVEIQNPVYEFKIPFPVDRRTKYILQAPKKIYYHDSIKLYTPMLKENIKSDGFHEVKSKRCNICMHTYKCRYDIDAKLAMCDRCDKYWSTF